MTNLINPGEIIKDKGIGKLIGTIKTDSESHFLYEKSVMVVKSLNNPYGYETYLFKNIYSLKNNKFFESKEKEQIIYFGKDKNKAIECFDKIVEKDKKEKRNLIDKIFGKI